MIHTIRAGDAAHLQSAIHASQPGDDIVLPAGARYVGTFTLPPKAGQVTIRTPAWFVTERIEPEDASSLATIASGSSGRAIDGTGAKNWTLVGIRFEPNVGGFGEVLGFEWAENIILDAILLVVPEGQQQKRGVLGNGRHITLTRSHLSGIWREGQDSQAFAAWDGPGPYTITDNYLEAASENILFGGADASSPENIPADILIDGNTLTKNLAWKGQPRQVKNLLELKCAKRVTIRNNLLEHHWADAQSGRAILFTPRNQDGTAPFTVIEDVLFERNTIRDVPMVFNIAGYDDINMSRQTTRIVIRDNDIQTAGMPFLIQSGCGRVEIYRNTVTMPPDNPILSLDRGSEAYAADSLVFAETASPGSYIHSSIATGEAALQLLTGFYTFTVPYDSPVPSVPPVISGPPSPLLGTQMPIPSLPVDPVADLAVKLEALTQYVREVEVNALALNARLNALLDYLNQAPNTSKAQALAAYLRGAK